MKSMTGYGRARMERNGRMITVEMKAVNHRYFDCTVKTPRQYGFLEDVIKKAASAHIARGKIEIFISIEIQENSDIAIKVNYPLVEQYLAALRDLGERYHLTNDITVSQLANLPDVIGSERVEQDTEILKQDVCAVFQSAYDEFCEMRAREGRRMAEDIYTRCAKIETMVNEIEKRSPERVEEYRERLLRRMQEVLEDTSIEPTRIVEEAAIYADKIAVDEETVRLHSHLHQLDKMLHETQPIGRKLDFLVQEMNREVNTIGSKSNDTAMAHLVVDLKSEIEKIREQVQNVE